MTFTEFLLQNPGKFISSVFKDKDGNPLILANYQLDFVKSVLNRKSTRYIYKAATQSGKSEAIACVIAVMALFYPNERIINVSYTADQARIIFERVKSHLVEDSEEIRKFVDMDRSLGYSKEFSKNRMFLKNSTEIRVLSTGTGETENVGESLLGFEATILIVDEAGSISNDVFYTKILRMVGAKRTTGFEKIVILSGTPHKANHFKDSWDSGRYEKYTVNWQMAVAAGRLDIKTVEEQKEFMPGEQFQSFYEAEFPDMSEEGIFNRKEIDRNIIPKGTPFTGNKILGVDVARFGSDFTVYTIVDEKDGTYRMINAIKQDHKDLMQISGKIMELNQKNQFDKIIIDASGIGGGVVDRLKEQGIKAISFIAGSKCTTEKAAEHFLNLKAEMAVKAKKLFEMDKLKVNDIPELKRDLMTVEKDLTSSGKFKVVDPAKSPDFLDSLLCTLYKSNPGAFIIMDFTTSEKAFTSNWTTT